MDILVAHGLQVSHEPKEREQKKSNQSPRLSGFRIISHLDDNLTHMLARVKVIERLLGVI